LARPVAVDAGSFDPVVAGSEVPVLVDFYADWCGPCRLVGPVVEAVARARAGSVLVLKVDTDKSPGLSERLGIRGIPTLIAFRNGRETGRHVGVAQRAQLDALLGAG
jgi:thioredoxin